MDQSKTPLFDQLQKHQKENPVSLHVPGHKFGEVFSEKGQSFYTDILKLDATEITGLDDLHSPEGVILEAEGLLSDLYRTQKSYFLINGSTVGNLAMILAVLKEDDRVLVQRNSHKSIMNGIKMAKAQPVFLTPEYDPVLGVAGGMSVETVKLAISNYPDVKAIILTYPNYFGMVYDLKSIIEFAHGQGIPVLVDEAHGVHFLAGDYFPQSAVEFGADIVVQSAHKMLPAMTMGAYLHYQSKLVRNSDVQFYLQALQSSSPSYPLMASLDLARSYLGTYNLDDMRYVEQEIDLFFSKLNGLEQITVLKQHDPLKMVIQPNYSWSGYEFQRILESKGVFTELADPGNVLLVLPLLKNGMKHRLHEAADKIAAAANEIPVGSKLMQPKAIKSKMIGELAVTYKDMDLLETEVLNVGDAAGRICAESIIPYPPGIPMILPGERMSGAEIETIMYLLEIGAKIQGGEHLPEGKIRVFKSWGI